MRLPLRCAVTLSMALSALAGPVADGDELTLVGWGVDERNLDQFMADAKHVGFDALITWSVEPDAVARVVEAAAPHEIAVFSCLAPMGRLARAWQQQHPERPVPWQVMSEDEQAAASFIGAGRNRYIIPYQWGGEPVMTNEVLLNEIICMSDEDAVALLEQQIDDLAAVPGLEGIALDGFGYQNFRCCYRERCEGLLADYTRANPEMPEEEATQTFFREMLVDYINHLADYARERRGDIRTTIHVWPVFAPEPLCGNRLDVDFCGQTAAWYALWPQEKIAEYSRIIVEDANLHYERPQGVGMIGYYDRPGEFPVKDAARVEMELATMIENGCRRIQVCSTIHVINSAEIAEVFRRFFSQ